MTKLVVFLGNPGTPYRNTRHNLPWLLLGHLEWDEGWKQKFKGMLRQVKLGDNQYYILKPLTFMNRCGPSVQATSQFFRFSPQELLIVHDESEIPFGQHGFKENGGLSGHNGLRSITESLATKNFRRLRLGVGKPTAGALSSHVLGRFSPLESEHLGGFLDSAATALVDFLTDN